MEEFALCLPGEIQHLSYHPSVKGTSWQPATQTWDVQIWWLLHQILNLDHAFFSAHTFSEGNKIIQIVCATLSSISLTLFILWKSAQSLLTQGFPGKIYLMAHCANCPLRSWVSLEHDTQSKFSVSPNGFFPQSAVDMFGLSFEIAEDLKGMTSVHAFLSSL